MKFPERFWRICQKFWAGGPSLGPFHLIPILDRRPIQRLVCLSGMVDIARQTVEFLYEENGGIPRDLYLPTIEDIKDEANKFTIDKVRKGTPA